MFVARPENVLVNVFRMEPFAMNAKLAVLLCFAIVPLEPTLIDVAFVVARMARFVSRMEVALNNARMELLIIHVNLAILLCFATVPLGP